MDVIKSWAYSVIAAASVTAAVSFLSPSGIFNKSMKIVIALFVLICFISPFIKSDISEILSSDVEGISKWLYEGKVKRDADYEVKSMLEKTIQSGISAYLESKGAEKYRINAKVNIDESNNIRIQKIIISLFEEADIADLKSFVESEYEITPEITLSTEE